MVLGSCLQNQGRISKQIPQHMNGPHQLLIFLLLLFLSVKVIVPRFSYYDWMCAVLRN